MLQSTSISKLNKIEDLCNGLRNEGNLNKFRNRKSGRTTANALGLISAAMANPNSARSTSFESTKERDRFNSLLIHLLDKLNLNFFKLDNKDGITSRLTYQPFYEEDELLLDVFSNAETPSRSREI